MLKPSYFWFWKPSMVVLAEIFLSTHFHSQSFKHGSVHGIGFQGLPNSVPHCNRLLKMIVLSNLLDSSVMVWTWVLPIEPLLHSMKQVVGGGCYKAQTHITIELVDKICLLIMSFINGYIDWLKATVARLTIPTHINWSVRHTCWPSQWQAPLYIHIY